MVDGYFEKTSELYDVGLGFSSDWAPVVDTATLKRGNRLFLTGSLFQGISQASGGDTQDSSTNYPIVQLRSMDSYLKFLDHPGMVVPLS